MGYETLLPYPLHNYVNGLLLFQYIVLCIAYHHIIYIFYYSMFTIKFLYLCFAISYFSVYSVMHKYLTDRDEVKFDTIFDQRIGKFLSNLDF